MMIRSTQDEPNMVIVLLLMMIINRMFILRIRMMNCSTLSELVSPGLIIMNMIGNV